MRFLHPPRGIRFERDLDLTRTAGWYRTTTGVTDLEKGRFNNDTPDFNRLRTGLIRDIHGLRGTGEGDDHISEFELSDTGEADLAARAGMEFRPAGFIRLRQRRAQRRQQKQQRETNAGD